MNNFVIREKSNIPEMLQKFNQDPRGSITDNLGIKKERIRVPKESQFDSSDLKGIPKD